LQELEILKGAEEFDLGDGPIGVLLLHGFTGSPQSIRGLGEHLAEAGFRVMGARLPGHATTWEDLDTKTSEDWANATARAFDEMRSECEEVFVVGLSFGVALALDLAAKRSDEIAGLVSLSGFMSTKDPLRFLAPILPKLVRSVRGVGNDICDENAREICYERLPTSAGLSMLRFVRRVRSELSGVRCPLLVIHSRNDHTATPHNAELITNGVRSSDKELVWLERSYHVITLDLDRDEVFKRTLEFIESRSKRMAG
jgi:carboxylesterase